MSVIGPTLGRVTHRIPLRTAPAPPGRRVFRHEAGGATASDGSLRVVFRDVVFAIDPDAQRVRWQRDLSDLEPRPEEELDDDPDPDPVDADVLELPPDPAEQVPPVHGTLPTILADDRTLVTLHGEAVIVSAQGELQERVAVMLVDRYGPAANIDLEGRPIFTTMGGGVHVWQTGGLRQVACGLGYDLPPVAVFADGSLAAAGYASRGLCRVGLDGNAIWRTDLKYADLMPTVNRAQCTAVGSLNDRCSKIFDPDGRCIASYPAAAMFAEYEADGGWIALADQSLARLSPAGEPRWAHPLDAPHKLCFGRYQPIVDTRGAIYIATDRGIAVFDGDGRQRAALPLGGRPMPLIPVRAGLIATIVDDVVLLIE